MPGKHQSKSLGAIDPKASTAERIKQIVYSLDPGAERRAAHLVNLALATFKDLALHSESDDLRYRAAEAILRLAPVQAKLEVMRATIVTPPVTEKATRPMVMTRRLRALMTSPERTAELLAMVEEAERQARPLEKSA